MLNNAPLSGGAGRTHETEYTGWGMHIVLESLLNKSYDAVNHVPILNLYSAVILFPAQLVATTLTV